MPPDAVLSLVTTSNAIRGLASNLSELAPTRNHVQMGNLKFDSLCHSVAASVKEVASKLADLTPTEDAILRQRSLEARKMLLECATGAVDNSGHPFKAFAHLEALSKACAGALEVSEAIGRRKVVSAAAPAVEALDALEKSSSYKSLFSNVKIFGGKLHDFLSVTAALVHDIRCEKSRSGIVARAETVKKLLPLIIQSLRDSLRHPMNSHTRSSREYFFGIVRSCLAEMVRIVEQLCGGKAPAGVDEGDKAVREGMADTGQFVKTLDSALAYLDQEDLTGLDKFHKFNDDVNWMVRFSLSVAKVSSGRSEEEGVVEACHSLIREATCLKTALAAEEEQGYPDDSSCSGERYACKEAIEVLEQTINNCLLKLIIELFCTASVSSPLDDLIHRILNSKVSPPDRLPEDVDDLVDAFDDHADTMFHVAHYTAFCTTDAKRSLGVATSLQLMQELEREMVPACLRLYFNPDDHGARSHLKALRTLWARELESVESKVLGIVDATAFCYVVNEEVKNVARAIKRELYTQNKMWLRAQGQRIVKMCQRAVDFAWKDSQQQQQQLSAECTGSLEQQQQQQQGLPDDHPVVKVERSAWEVQAAIRMVLSKIEDLNLHKTMIRRVQVLTTCLNVMAHFLLSKNESAMSASKVRVLTSVSRITIGGNEEEEAAAAATAAAVSKAGGGGSDNSVGRNKSFRNVRRKESLLVRRHKLHNAFLGLIKENEY
jgi:hypothetical protein